MPQKHTIKSYEPHSYYHIFSRGVNKQAIFNANEDYARFIMLFDRYLSGQVFKDSAGRLYPSYSTELSLVSYCLMNNHVHLLVYQHSNERALSLFMSSLMTSYSKYFNLRHKRLGALFESRYKARKIDNESHLIHISRYIHMNPRSWIRYSYSSLQYIHSDVVPDWLDVGLITDEFIDRKDYMEFLHEYQGQKDKNTYIKQMLADNL